MALFGPIYYLIMFMYIPIKMNKKVEKKIKKCEKFF